MECWATEKELLCPQEYEDWEHHPTRGDIRIVPQSHASFKIYLPPQASSWMCGASICFGSEDEEDKYNLPYKKVKSETSRNNKKRIAEILKELENAKR